MSFEYYQASIRHLMFTDVLICDNYVYVYIYIYTCMFVTATANKCIFKYDSRFFKFVVLE